MGIWALGTKKQVQKFIDEIEDLKDKYHGTVGSDGVYNGLDEAIREAKDVLEYAREGCHETDDGVHGNITIDVDGTVECMWCGLRNSKSEKNEI